MNSHFPISSYLPLCFNILTTSNKEHKLCRSALCNFITLFSCLFFLLLYKDKAILPVPDTRTCQAIFYLVSIVQYISRSAMKHVYLPSLHGYLIYSGIALSHMRKIYFRVLGFQILRTNHSLVVQITASYANVSQFPRGFLGYLSGQEAHEYLPYFTACDRQVYFLSLGPSILLIEFCFAT